MNVKINVSPISVNECWQGRRFKTAKYKVYEKALLLLLPAQIMPLPPFVIYFEFGLSNICSDWDNPIKPLQDILQKRYGFNDRDILEASVIKKKVSKGSEYFIVKIKSIIKN